jgi:hypothetical protein
MNEWEIVRIEDDPGASAADDRWLVVYSVPLEYSPGTFSYSFPKSIMNTYAALYEYDVDDPGQVDDLFDFIMSRPMLKARPLDAGMPSGHPSLLTAEAATRIDSLSPSVNAARLAAHPKHALSASPAQLRATIKDGIAAMKRGEAPLVAGREVALRISGMPDVAGGSENPKYILKRDMVARLNKDRVAAGRNHYRQQRVGLISNGSA